MRTLEYALSIYGFVRHRHDQVPDAVGRTPERFSWACGHCVFDHLRSLWRTLLAETKAGERFDNLQSHWAAILCGFRYQLQNCLKSEVATPSYRFVIS